MGSLFCGATQSLLPLPVTSATAQYQAESYPQGGGPGSGEVLQPGEPRQADGRKIAGRVSDGRIFRLIRAFLEAGVMERGLVSTVDQGTPQRGRVMESITHFLASKLRLKVNNAKSVVTRPWEG